MASQTEEMVYAVDVEPQMLDLLREAAAKAQVSNIECIESDLEQIQLIDESVDKVLAALVIHEAADIQQALKEIKRILRPDGQAVILEWEAVPTKNGPPLQEKIPSASMLDMVRNNGFTAETLQFNATHYAIIAVASAGKGN